MKKLLIRLIAVSCICMLFFGITGCTEVDGGNTDGGYMTENGAETEDGSSDKEATPDTEEDNSDKEDAPEEGDKISKPEDYIGDSLGRVEM